jgi:formate transporter
MDYIKPAEVINTLLANGKTKAELSTRDVLIRGFLSGSLLGFATTLAIAATLQTSCPIVGALIFPVGFVMIIVLGLELVTGSFAVVTLAGVDGRAPWGRVMSNLGWAFVGNLAGSVAYGALLYIALTNMGSDAPTGIAAKIAALAEAKTNGFAAHGYAGMATVFVKAILCNWMVCLGVVMGLTSSSTLGKIAAAWLPVVIFFGLGFEHSVVNMFLIPTGMLFGAKVSFASWWAWNQIPVTLGNLVGGMLFAGLPLYWTFRPAKAPMAAQAESAQVGDGAAEPAGA